MNQNSHSVTKEDVALWGDDKTEEEAETHSDITTTIG